MEENVFARLEKLIEQTYTPEEAAVLRKAYELSESAHRGQKRKSGEPYIIHPIAVSEILIGFGMDYQSIAAALLHDVAEDTAVTIAQLRKMFGAEISTLVDGVTKLGKVPLDKHNQSDRQPTFMSRESEQAENLRKLLLAMSEDIRVIIIKLADRLHNMRTIQFQPEQKRRDISLETIEIYAPIAHRLGIRPVKDELEDLAIANLDPVAYADIEKALAEQEPLRMEFLEDIKTRVKDRVSEIVENPEVSGRIKTVHGIYRKMYMHGKEFEEIYDIYAIRIIVDTVGDCYNCLGVIHDMFKPIPGRFKDYISTPKPNMYQSLHTTLIGKEGIPFEVQIRTWEMHKTAEYGIAAHWKYKLGYTNSSHQAQAIEKGLGWVTHILEAQNESGDAADIVTAIKSDIVREEVYVFIPKGDVMSLPAGSTVIDFAYAIHSAVGNKMTGAKVDKRIVPLDYTLKNGEIVEVLTTSQPGKGPSRDWLKIVRTSEARSKIRAWFKKERREENIIEGRQDVEREIRRSNIRLSEEQEIKLMEVICDKQKCATPDDFFAAIGYGGIVLSKIMPMIKDEANKIINADAPKQTAQARPKRTVSSDGVVVEGIDNCLVKLSRCCSPIPGDDIIGFITRGHGISVHKRDCTNVPSVISLASEPERWIGVYWGANVKTEFNASLILTCLAGKLPMSKVFDALESLHIIVQSVNTRDTKDGRKLIYLTATVNGVEHLRTVMARLEKLDGILSVDRGGV
ncbi:MAG: bifunctional (p)ppGpp synthetase/guanosine-3',5'-bis(diphosphate) 3'-pyrophosphohydrolase [Clostridia bacterium]|nr:bifunctional (p)ppGpp synthetase/guanosine-3',5'-bis(diphosphate) 3'-pyrophosphohydrolase [Clostridia bacterium]